ncbi:MAG: hypothetical protein ACRCX2_28365 [Paraclostridium sp.]
MAKFKMNLDDLDVLKEIKSINKINGQIRTVTVEIDDPEVAKYAIPTDSKFDPNYNYSDGDGTQINYFDIPEIKDSIDGMVKGKKRPSEELDRISEVMARVTAEKVVDFIESGAHRNYQKWKGTNDENLIVSGKLRDSIVGVAYRKGKEIYRGR